jgi:propanediol dehydratase small subunit
MSTTSIVMSQLESKLGLTSAQATALRCAVVFALALTVSQRQLLRVQIEALDSAFDRALDDILFRQLRSAIQKTRIAGTTVGALAVGRDVGIDALNAKFDVAAAFLNRVPIQRIIKECPAVANVTNLMTRGAKGAGLNIDVGSVEDIRLAKDGLTYDLQKFTDLDTGLNMGKVWIQKQKESLTQWIGLLDILDTIEGT